MLTLQAFTGTMRSRPCLPQMQTPPWLWHWTGDRSFCGRQGLKDVNLIPLRNGEALFIFMAVFATRHPGRVAELLKYAETVKTASLQFPGFGWRSYDEQFRLRQEQNPLRSWAELDVELWVTVAAASSLAIVNNSLTSTGTGGRTGLFPGQSMARSGQICFSYNSEKGCHWQGCRFTHKCRRCGIFGHAAFACNIRQRSGVGGRTRPRVSPAPAAKGVGSAAQGQPVAAKLRSSAQVS